MYLVDTNIVSAGAPRRTGAADLVRWMDEHSASLYLSVVTVAEIEDGIAKAHREKARRKAAEFAHGSKRFCICAPVEFLPLISRPPALPERCRTRHAASVARPDSWMLPLQRRRVGTA